MIHKRCGEWEHTFVTGEARAHVRFRRAIECRALWMAEDAARELPNLPLEDALQLVKLYGERGSPKYEKAALRWLERYRACARRRCSEHGGPRARTSSWRRNATERRLG